MKSNEGGRQLRGLVILPKDEVLMYDDKNSKTPLKGLTMMQKRWIENNDETYAWDAVGLYFTPRPTGGICEWMNAWMSECVDEWLHG